MKRILMMILTTTLLIACEQPAGGSGDGTTETPDTTTPDTTTPDTTIGECDDEQMYKNWAYDDTDNAREILLLLENHTLGSRLTESVRFTYPASSSFGECSYYFELTGDGCSGTYIISNPAQTVGGVDCNPLLATDGTATYERTGDTLKLCNGGTCIEYSVKE